MLTASELKSLNESFSTQTTAEIMRWAWERFGTRAAIGTSFQGAGLVMMHLAKINHFAFPVFTLDTGFLFPETIELKRKLEEFYGFPIEGVHPDITVEQQDEAEGPELYKRNPDLCCTIRKVLPLQSKLADIDCWITGVRREQSDTRSDVGIVEVYVFDEATKRDIVKLSPMANWSREKVWEYIKGHRIPYNPLHDQGYTSIGCWPCTRAVMFGEDERAGRWSGTAKTECGLHTTD